MHNLTELQRENDILRGLLAKLSKSCHYCGLADMSRCAHGFPGCPLADDILCAMNTMEDSKQYRLLKGNSRGDLDPDSPHSVSHFGANPGFRNFRCGLRLILLPQ